ncbi:MAG TPA: trehalose-6-phosphate synthase, partial [Terriglobales bacterium]|nr:trehalose-6-phosphate synthase [Terriglobales bacterium]
MRLLRVRLIVPLILGIALVSLLSSWYEVHMALRGLRGDLEKRAEVLGDSLVGNVERALDRGSDRDLENIVLRFGNREHLAGIAICDDSGAFLAITPNLRSQFQNCPASVIQAIADNRERGAYLRPNGSYLHIYALPIHRANGAVAGGMAVVDDAGYIQDEGWRMWRQIFLRVLLEALLIALATLLIIRWSITGPIARAAQWMHGLRTGRIFPRQEVPDYDFFRPLAREVTTFAESLKQARVAAETEARLREAGESLWTPERLAVHVRGRLGGSRLFVVANREPYMHLRKGKAVEMIVPASGLVAALEPVLRTCDGTWVA